MSLRSKWSMAGFLGLLGILIPFFIFGVIIFDDFEDYSLGNLTGQGIWRAFEENPSNQVISNPVYEGSRAISGNIYADSLNRASTTERITGEGYGYFRLTDDSSEPISTIFLNGSSEGFGLNNSYYYHEVRWHVYCDGAFQVLQTGLSPDTWYKLGIKWNADEEKIWVNLNDGEWVEKNCLIDPLIWILVRNFNQYAFIDFLQDFGAGIPELRVWGVSPASGTEITSATTSFTFAWEGFDLEYYDGLIISFYEEKTGIHSFATEYTAEQLGDTSGEKTLALTNFNFDRNGKWYFHAIAYYETITAYYPMVWATEFTLDLVSPDYFLNINIEGLPPIFEMETWEDWYAENTPYETSTAVFSAIANFLSPFFSKIGEFGTRLTIFFNQDEAYARGENLSKDINTFNLYLSIIDKLFPFPLVRIFFICMILMGGIFLIKLILKIFRGA